MSLWSSVAESVCIGWDSLVVPNKYIAKKLLMFKLIYFSLLPVKCKSWPDLFLLWCCQRNIMLLGLNSYLF